ncbi:MAG: queuosine precursor transporter [Polyangia bacterium]
MQRSQRVYVFLAALFVAALIAGDFIGGKFFVFAGHSLSAGIIPFPLTFVLTDVVNEFYGKRGAQLLTYAGLVAAIFVWSVINLALVLPTTGESPISDLVFRSAFGTSARLYVASLCAYLVGQLLDISVFGVLRRLTGERLLWLRSTGSTVFSQAIDSISVSFVFLVGARPLGYIMSNAANNYVGKLVMAVLLTPLIYAGHAVFYRYLGAPEAPETLGAEHGRLGHVDHVVREAEANLALGQLAIDPDYHAE